MVKRKKSILAEDSMTKASPKNRLFVWYATRISFWVMVFLWITLSYLSSPDSSLNLFDIAYLISTPATFVFSIIHLTKYEEKKFAITSLVISSIGLLLVIIGMIVGIVQMNMW